MDTLARLENVSKIFPRVHRPGERLRAFASILTGSEPSDGAKVLSDINLEVFRGQSLGIIGENGAGKSTLLKVLTGVIQPTAGKVTLNAKVAPLLELGAGFQPEFSGLDNVRMKAAILGLDWDELKHKLDDILAFADIGEYIHEPVKHYSSGMVVRLGFAVVTAANPELLITDEVLAVGDESFQKKCIRWMSGFLERGGTLLMVSHSMYHVQRLCHRAIWLHNGSVRRSGDVEQVTQDYLAWHEQRSVAEKKQRAAVSGNDGHYRVAAVDLEGAADQDAELPVIEHQLRAEVGLYSPDGRMPVCLVGIERADGTPIYGISSDTDHICGAQYGEHQFRFRVEFSVSRLLPGRYHFKVHAMDPEAIRVCDTHDLSFQVRGKSEEFGLVRLPYRWLTSEEDASD